MRIPDPKAVTAEEAYLGYKAEIIEESELKPSLYEPDLHFDGWLAYWCGLTATYPVKNVGKNLFNKNNPNVITGYIDSSVSVITANDNNRTIWIPCKANTTYTIQKLPVAGNYRRSIGYTTELPAIGVQFYGEVHGINGWSSLSITTGNDAKYLVVRLWVSTQDTDTLEEMLDSVQIEEGSSATSYESYSGEPEMLCDEEALVAYLSGVTDTYPEEIKDPYDVRITGYLRYLCSYRFGRPEYPVTNSEFYLSLLDAPHTSNETPSTDIELDTSEGKLIDVKAYGDTFQQTYSGKNLYLPKGTTNNGLTLIYNEETGQCSITGTATDSWADFTTWQDISLPAGTYTFSTSNAVGESGLRNLILRINDGSTSVDSSLGTGTSSTVTTTINGTRVRVWAGTTANTQVNWNGTLQLEKGSEPTSFEKFCGGIPSPNPDYPQNIQVVTGEQTVEVHGKNLFDKYTAVNTSNDYYLNPDETISTTASDYQTGRRYMTMSLAAGSYCLSYRPYFSGVNSPKIRYTIRNMDASTDIVAGYEDSLINGQLYSLSFTTTDSITLGICIMPVDRLETGQSFYFDETQLEQGSTATTYQPYQSHDYKVNLGKNLFDKDNATLLEAYFDGSHTSLTGASTNRTAYLKVKPNTTYTISKLLSVRNFIGITQTEPVVGTSVSNIANMGNGYYDGVTRVSGTLTTGPNDNYIVVNYTNINSETGDIPTNILNSIQIEEGSTATSFAPYFTPIELCKIGDYQDYIYKDNDDWYVKKACDSYTFNGTEPFGLNQTNGFVLIYNSSSPFYGILALGEPSYQSFCNMFTFQRNSSTWTGAGKCGFNSAGAFWLIHTQSMPNQAAIQTWLTNNTTTVYYPLATPTDTKITDSALISQLEALAGADTYNEKTFIKVTANDPNLPALLKVEAYKY